MAATTVDAVRSLLAAQLHYSDDVLGTSDVTKIESFWTPIITEAVAEAEAWLRATLGGMGFPATEIATWPLFVHYQKRLALFWCGVYGDSQLTEDQRGLLNRLDPRSEVQAVTTLGGTADEDARVGVGLLERDDDLFRRPSVNGNGSLPADVFNTRRAWTGRDCWR